MDPTLTNIVIGLISIAFGLLGGMAIEDYSYNKTKKDKYIKELEGSTLTNL